MSTLKVTTIQDESGSNATTVEEINKGRAKAWLNFDGTFDASSYGDEFTTANSGIRAAFNVSSVTDIALGRYTANFTNAMPDTDYAAVSHGYYGNVTNENGYLTLEDARIAARTTSSFTLATTTTSVYNDSAITSIVIFR